MRRNLTPRGRALSVRRDVPVLAEDGTGATGDEIRDLPCLKLVLYVQSGKRSLRDFLFLCEKNGASCFPVQDFGGMIAFEVCGSHTALDLLQSLVYVSGGHHRLGGVSIPRGGAGTGPELPPHKRPRRLPTTTDKAGPIKPEAIARDREEYRQHDGAPRWRGRIVPEPGAEPEMGVCGAWQHERELRATERAESAHPRDNGLTALGLAAQAFAHFLSRAPIMTDGAGI